MDKHNVRKAVTARDVAEACGVSQATVSYVINNSSGGRISDATRQRVLDTARKMGYCPSQSARSMRMSRAMAVGVVLGGNSLSLGVSHALRGIKNRMDAAGYAQMLLSDEDDVLPGVDYLSQYRAYRCASVFVQGFIGRIRERIARTASSLYLTQRAGNIRRSAYAVQRL